MIEVLELKKKFGAVQAVDGASFQAEDGQVTGLLGPNGAGKTTTLRMLYGLIHPDAGSIRLDGLDVLADPLGAQKHIGALTDARGLYVRLTTREHIRYYGELRQMTLKAISKETDRLTELLDMGAILDRRTQGFSQGERMKVALACALVHSPRNLLLDEPTNGLDVMSTRAVRGLITHLKDAGHCVIFSSHIMQEVSALCDRIVVMAKGRVVATGSGEELLERSHCDNLEDAFLVLAGEEECP